MPRLKQDLIKDLLTKEERKSLYVAGNILDREDLKPGMIFLSRAGTIHVFKEIRVKKYGRKEFLFWEGSGGGAPIETTLMYMREVTELLNEQHPELPDKVFPDWLND